MLVISTQNWSILAKFAKKNPAKSAVFYWLILGEVSPRNFRWNRPIFVIICLRISFKIWLFSAKIPRNRPIFLRILTFLPRKTCEIGRFFSEFLLFSRENPAKSVNFSANLSLKIPQNFAFFSTKYQKPCFWHWLVPLVKGLEQYTSYEPHKWWASHLCYALCIDVFSFGDLFKPNWSKALA